MATVTLGVLSTAAAPSRRSSPPSSETSDHGDAKALEIALLRRGLAGPDRDAERCGRCARTLLMGERVYEYPSGATRCALCRERERQAPADSHLVRGRSLGHSIRVIDRRDRA